MTRKDDVMLIIELHREVELLKTALQYSNSTAKLALGVSIQERIMMYVLFFVIPSLICIWRD